MLGDYIDRRPDSRGVLDLLASAEMSARFDPVFLLGNHGAVFLSAIRGELAANDMAVWLRHNGGAETLESYGADLRRHGPDDFLRRWGDWMPPAHVRFLGALLTSHTESGLFFSHTGADPDRPLADQPAETLLYGASAMFEFDDRDCLGPLLRERLGARLVHGHWRSREGVVVFPHRIGVDTGAGYADGGVLSVVAIDGEDVRVFGGHDG